jgi:hypothetical protein
LAAGAHRTIAGDFSAFTGLFSRKLSTGQAFSHPARVIRIPVSPPQHV